ncbi:MAG: hypothetical protein O7D29_03785 [Gemmatimonadetes bacterium]|nr:hypothetical protein [Gemmatimonadota bacterium]
MSANSDYERSRDKGLALNPVCVIVVAPQGQVGNESRSSRKESKWWALETCESAGTGNARRLVTATAWEAHAAGLRAEILASGPLRGTT